jgi:hypothetical protein
VTDTYTIVISIFPGLLGLVALAAAVTAARHRMMPLEKRVEYARLKLLKNETPTGATQILSAIGVTDEKTKAIAAAEGFDWVGYSGQSDRQLNFQRPITRPVNPVEAEATVARSTWPAFLTGPSLTELRKHPYARATADRIRAELGIDPLSDTALKQAREQHSELRRKTLRYVALATCSGFALLIVLLSTAKQLIAGTGNTPVIAIVAVLLLIGLSIGWAFARNANKARQAATSGYAQAYERLVAAVLRSE